MSVNARVTVQGEFASNYVNYYMLNLIFVNCLTHLSGEAHRFLYFIEFDVFVNIQVHTCCFDSSEWTLQRHSYTRIDCCVLRNTELNEL